MSYGLFHKDSATSGIQYWEAKLSDVNLDALAQHYGFATHLMDLTNDFKAALFFATCKYVPETDSYRPLTQADIDKNEDTRYRMMDGGKKVFPNEGVTELHDYIEQIKHSVVFAMDELQAVYDCDGVDKTIFPTIDDLKKALVGYTFSDGVVAIQDEPIVYDIPKDILDVVNSHYDGKDLIAVIGGMLHQKYPDQEYRKQRCIEIYGKLI